MLDEAQGTNAAAMPTPPLPPLPPELAAWLGEWLLGMVQRRVAERAAAERAAAGSGAGTAAEGEPC